MKRICEACHFIPFDLEKGPWHAEGCEIATLRADLAALRRDLATYEDHDCLGIPNDLGPNQRIRAESAERDLAALREEVARLRGVCRDIYTANVEARRETERDLAAARTARDEDRKTYLSWIRKTAEERDAALLLLARVDAAFSLKVPDERQEQAALRDVRAFLAAHEARVKGGAP